MAIAKLVDVKSFIWTSFLKPKKAFFLSSFTWKPIHAHALVDNVGQDSRLVSSGSRS
jgi:hypothetical protein